MFKPTAFASKSLSGAERQYSNTEREALGILYGMKNSATNILQKDKCHHYSHAIGNDVQERYKNPITTAPIYTTQNPSVKKSAYHTNQASVH